MKKYAYTTVYAEDFINASEDNRAKYAEITNRFAKEVLGRSLTGMYMEVEEETMNYIFEINEPVEVFEVRFLPIKREARDIGFELSGLREYTQDVVYNPNVNKVNI